MMIKNIKILRLLFFSKHGFVLVYIIALMLIFGLLGALMVSLFSTSVTSSATKNDARRAFYISESGKRYAQSELWASNFSKSRIAELNANSSCQDGLLHFNISATEKFCLNIFSPWFEYVSSTGNTITVHIPEGQIPDGFLDTIPAGDNFFLVNYDYVDVNTPPDPPTSMSRISGSPIPGTGTSFQFELLDPFVASSKENIAMAVLPAAGGQKIPLTQNYLDLKPVAKNIFPAEGGVFEVQKRNFFYKKSEELNNGNISLTGISPVQGVSSTDITVRSIDPVILSPRNRLIISEGKSGDVAFGKTLNYATAIANTSTVNPDSQKPDIKFKELDLTTDLNIIENTPFITADNSSKNINIERDDVGGSSKFGATWFSADMSIGGNNNFCQTGECLFNNGIRVFFILNYTGDDGDGFTFSVIDGVNNGINSVGGDIQMSELLAYAGDSRKVPTLTGSKINDFLDGEGNGIKPPKMAVEFDGKTNNNSTDFDICSSDPFFTPKFTRSDPTGSLDRVQYVFWGSNDILIRAWCKLDAFHSIIQNNTYDDNRHDTERDGSGSPNNDKSLDLTPAKLGVLSGNNWLTQGPWAIRIEIDRNPYVLRTWMKKCAPQTDPNIPICSDIGPFYRNTRYKYDWTSISPLIPLEQSFSLNDPNDFNQFLFGFTSATTSPQNIIISDFQLSFVRSNDSTERD